MTVYKYHNQLNKKLTEFVVFNSFTVAFSRAENSFWVFHFFLKYAILGLEIGYFWIVFIDFLSEVERIYNILQKNRRE